MDNKIIDIEKKLKENLELTQNESKNDINKKSDTNTTNEEANEEDSIYIIDEIISYCSSPTSGLVSIKKTKKNNNLLINIGSDISNITNTITFTIAMIKKEINKTEINNGIGRSNTSKKKVNKEQKDNDRSEEHTSELQSR